MRKARRLVAGAATLGILGGVASLDCDDPVSFCVAARDLAGGIAEVATSASSVSRLSADVPAAAAIEISVAATVPAVFPAPG